MENVIVVDGVREIAGVVFHVRGDEFIATLNKRVEEHKAAAKEAQEALPGALAAAQATQEALAVAGRSSKAPARAAEFETYSAPGGARAAMAMVKTSTRDYGGNVEDAVQALRNAVSHHTRRAVALKFYADHLKPGVEYVLGTHDVAAYELLDSTAEED